MFSRLARGATIAAMCAAGCGDDGGISSATQGSGSTAQTSEGSSSQGTSPTTGTVSGSGTSGGNSNSNSNSGSTSTGVDTSGGPTGGPTTNDPMTSTGPGTTTNTTSTTGPGTTTDTTTGNGSGVVRFIVIGDTGEGNEDQYAVADAIIATCEVKGCDFGMLTGDNFYDSGVSGTDDPQWQSKFEDVYMGIQFPMYAVLGNHDYGGNGIGVDFDTNKPDYQVEYTNQSQLWRMPAKYYSWKMEHAEFWGLDTNQIMTDPINGDAGTQQDWLDGMVGNSTATWKIAFGHHPYISNGDHGNAGAYENLEGIPLPFVTGENVKEFMEASICGKIDVYICGHDHNIQWLEPACGTEFIVSGAGSKSEGLPGSNPAFFGKAETEGFLWVELNDQSFTGVFYDKTGVELYSRTFMK